MMDPVTIAAPSRPRLTRVDDAALVGGVSTGLSAHLRWPLITVRLAFVGLAFFGGFGAVLYAAYWILLPVDPAATRPTGRRRVLQVVLGAAVAIGVVVTAAGSPSFLLPTLLACVGGAFLWRQADDGTRRHWSERSVSMVSATAGDRGGVARLAVGALLVVSAIVISLVRADVSSLGTTLSAVVIAAVGLALLTGPWWMRLVRELGDERRERIRSEERAELAARVHDSVLQTLALIQRRADSPREVARLARGQERELRTLLWGDPAARSTTVAGALRDAAAEVEDSYGVTVDVVAVGDAPIVDAGEALAAAAREAMVNAAKHAGVEHVSLYVEIEDGRAVVFVRDRGKGFDPDTVADDRLGLRRSVTERMERHGGTSSVHSAPGEGTEVELEVALT